MSSSESMLSVNKEAHESILKEDILKALKKDKGEDSVLESYEIIDFTKKGDNYACFVTSVKVNYSLNGNADSTSYIVKLIANKNVPAMENFNTMVFEKESKFYTYVIPQLDAILKECNQPPLRAPKCYYASFEKNKEVIYLEDMRTKKFKMSDRLVGLDKAHTELVLEELARLHAASAILAERNGTDNLETKFEFLRDLFTDTSDPVSAQMFKSFFDSFMETGVAIANKLEGYENVATFLKELSKDSLLKLESQMAIKDKRFTSVNHGDCWNNNLLFRYNAAGEPEELCLVDMQVNRSASLTLDLNYLLYSSLTGSVRKCNMQNFMEKYHATYGSVFKGFKKDMLFTVDELKKEFSDNNKFGLMMSMMVVPIVVMETTDTPDFSDISEENMEQKMKENQALILDMIDTSPNLRPRFLDMFDEFVESGLIPK